MVHFIIPFFSLSVKFHNVVDDINNPFGTLDWLPIKSPEGVINVINNVMKLYMYLLKENYLLNPLYAECVLLFQSLIYEQWNAH